MQLIIEGRTTEDVKTFTCLDSVVSLDGDVRQELEAHLGKAAGVFKRLKKVWKNTGLRINTKLQAFCSLVFFVMLYVSEAWKGFREAELRLRDLKVTV